MAGKAGGALTMLWFGGRFSRAAAGFEVHNLQEVGISHISNQEIEVLREGPYRKRCRIASLQRNYLAPEMAGKEGKGL